jgi:uncharacterized membrane protein (DUF373 family)
MLFDILVVVFILLVLATYLLFLRQSRGVVRLIAVIGGSIFTLTIILYVAFLGSEKLSEYPSYKSLCAFGLILVLIAFSLFFTQNSSRFKKADRG